MRSITEYKILVKEGQDVRELDTADIELEELKGRLFIEKGSPNTIKSDMEIMADINIISVCQDVLRRRRGEIANKEQQFNYNFVRNAPYFISKDIYDKIEQSAYMRRGEFRQMMFKQTGAFEKMK